MVRDIIPRLLLAAWQCNLISNWPASLYIYTICIYSGGFYIPKNDLLRGLLLVFLYVYMYIYECYIV